MDHVTYAGLLAPISNIWKQILRNRDDLEKTLVGLEAIPVGMKNI